MIHKLEGLEKNESAGLYTPRYLIRKSKIYTTLERKGNYKSAHSDPAARAAEIGRLQLNVNCRK
ncbi:MAG: hypothetical protein DME53_02950 [Verrucomicrobia bacterium]|nr:MAG: hypothetical protein DME56_11495 [Verrucomicrobiota bacterium]PYK46292.1 MAG: hypothetical protein DME53_02950 [Verrucomicrobiota bacterium]